MLTPAATAAWIASWPEWKYVPSPRFWMKCSRSTNCDIPSQGMPSPPIAVTDAMSPTRSSSISSAMV